MRTVTIRCMSLGAQDDAGLLRGSPERITDHMEQLQKAYVAAVVASAGCTLQDHRIDNGVDLTVGYDRDGMRGIRLDLQLKATAAHAGASPDSFAARMTRDRYDLFRDARPMVPRIVVIMNLPRDQAGWTSVGHDVMELRHAAYWVSLRGRPAVEGETVTIRAQREHLFDAEVLCSMMVRIGEGGVP